MTDSLQSSSGNAVPWPEAVNAWKYEKAAGRTIVFAIVSSMGALAAWSSLLPGTDVRRNPLFWLMAVPMMFWYGATQNMSRWSMVSLRGAIPLWPSLALVALLFSRFDLQWSEVHRLGTPTVLSWILGFTFVTAIVAYRNLRRSSLPGGHGTLVPVAAGHTPAGALPPADAALFALTPWIIVELFAAIFVGILGFVGMARAGGDIDRMINTAFLPLLGITVAMAVGIVWGQVQSRRHPARVSSAYVGMLILGSLYCIFTAIRLAAARFHPGGAVSGWVLVALAGTAVECGVSSLLYVRLRRRAASFARG